jgi:sugar lactone lactonase YvrE
MTLLGSILHPTHDAPHLDQLHPTAAMPGGEVEIRGNHLAAINGVLPEAAIGDTLARVAATGSTRTTLRIPDGSISGDVTLRINGAKSNALPLSVAVPLTDNVHPVANPAIDADGNLYTTLSGPRGQQMPVSIFRIDRDFQMRPFAREIMNPTGLAFDREGYLYCSSRAEGTVYRISPAGAITTYAEGMGIATGLAFDEFGNLFVGDRSGSIFKIAPGGEIFVHATLEPSMAAYHLALLADGTLLVAAPTTSSNEAIHSISPDGEVGVYYRGLGRPQGMAIDVHNNVYIAASLAGRRGIVRITPEKTATLAVSGPNLIGLCFTEDGTAALATRDALFHIDLQTEGRSLL